MELATKFSDFVSVQNRVYDDVRTELRAGRKASHWMWFIFPQLAGLGFSALAQKYSLSSLAEARAYLEHPVLGARLRECTQLVLAVPGRSVEQIFGQPDNLKFRSSLTLFSIAAPGEALFSIALEHFFEGKRDPLTLELLRRSDRAGRDDRGVSF